MEKLIEALKKTELGEFVVIDNCIKMMDLFIYVDEEEAVIFYDTRCRPDVASKISLLVFCFCKDSGKQFRFGKIYASEYNIYGIPMKPVVGEEAIAVHKKNVQMIQEHSNYFDSLLKLSPVEDLYSC